MMMKKLWLIFLIVVSAHAAEAQFKSATLQASGLTCALCSKSINKALEGLPFVAAVRADIKSASFAIEFKSGVSVDFDKLKAAVQDAGFSVAKLKVRAHFSDQQIENDVHLVLGDKTFHFLKVTPQRLDGDREIQFVDKDFLTAAAYKRYAASTTMECVKTGKAGNCCKKEGITANTRVYHITI
jgi:copper chaperone CopZ